MHRQRDRTLTLPSLLAPAKRVSVPPFPVPDPSRVPACRVVSAPPMARDPLEPSAVLPPTMEIEPAFPDEETPVVSEMEPESPFVPALLVWRVMLPEVPLELRPEVKEIRPPVLASPVLPAMTLTAAPMLPLLSPAARAIAPALPAAAAPVVIVTPPPVPDFEDPVPRLRAPDCPDPAPESAVVTDTEPLFMLEAPLVISTAPPLLCPCSFCPCAKPPAMEIFEPAPALLFPGAMEIVPALADDSPVETMTEPVSPAWARPDEMEISPLFPPLPPFAVAMVTIPLVLAVLKPLVSVSDPPVALAALPPEMETEPPMSPALEPWASPPLIVTAPPCDEETAASPAWMMTEPPALPACSTRPPFSVTAPPAPTFALPTRSEISPPFPPVATPD